MTTVFNIVIPVLAGITLLLALFFGVRAYRKRSAMASPFTYGVGRQEARQGMQVDIARSLLLFVAALILVGVFGLRPLSPAIEDEALLPAASPSPTATATAAVTPTATPEEPVIVDPVPEATPTIPQEIPTSTPTPLPTPTDTPEPPTAIVDSPNGLWLRPLPGTDEQPLENLAHQSVLILLEGREEADGIEWQQVRAPSGNEGWVAVAFIIYQQE